MYQAENGHNSSLVYASYSPSQVPSTIKLEQVLLFQAGVLVVDMCLSRWTMMES